MSPEGHSNIKSLHKLIAQIAFFDAQETKLVRIAYRHLETSLHRLNQSRFLRRPEATLYVLKSMEEQNVFAWPFHTLKLRFIDHQIRLLRLP
jgi:hypothetical protein